MTDPMNDLRQASADVSGVEVLSPAAQAVLDAATKATWSSAFNSEGKGAAAALRAVADQVVPEGYTQAYECCLGIMAEIREDLLAIAAELEGAQ